MYGYHYSPLTLETGRTVISRQGRAASYKHVWALYKRVADELGLYFPEEYAYAYPLDKTDLARFESFSEHIVYAPDSNVTLGNFHYGVYVTMDSYLGAPRDLPLSERLVERDRRIVERAYTYFTEITNTNAIELISDKWTVIDI
jgi:hypothetical protein